MNDANRLYNVGPHHIILPPEHMLDRYQDRWKRYDIALGEIARIFQKQLPSLTAIDIGANIGDSAALLNKYAQIPVLCIEGSPGFLSYLKTNAARIGGHVEIEECYIGSDGSSVDVSNIREQRGTASLIVAPNTEQNEKSVPMKSLETVIAGHPRFAKTALIKIDTDGFDFRILANSLETLNRLKPVLFFEYDPSFSVTGEAEALHAMRVLHTIGYSRFMVYDNFGNYLLTVRELERFVELNAYLRSNRKYGCVVYYFDICAFTDSHSSLFDEIISFELS